MGGNPGGDDTGGGRKPGDSRNPGGGIDTGDGTKPVGGETNPVDGTIPKHTVEDGRIVPIPGNGTGNDGAGTAGNGAVIVTVNNVDEALCTAQAADAVAVANAVLTEEEIRRVGQGETIEIRIDVERIDDKVSEQEKSVIEKGIGDAQKEVPGLTVGMYVDISMFLRQGKGEWNAVHRIDEPVEIVIDMPEALRELSADFYIVRAHEGECTLLDDLDDAAKTITIKTERFSTYAIAYQMLADKNGVRCGLCHICPTFLGICCFIWLLLIAAAVILLFVILRRRKERETQDEG